MLGSAVFRTGVAPGGALAPGWVKNELWRKARTVPSLDLRFADNKSLVDAVTGAQLVTFTRASSGTFVGSDGLIKTAVTNLLLRSEEFDNASWTATRSSVTANAITAPNGTLTADELVEDTTVTNTHNIGQSISFTSGTTYTISVFAKATASPRFLQIIFPSGAFTATRRPVFDLLNGIALAATDTTATIQNIGNGWYRCVASMLSTSTNSASIQLQLANTYTNSAPTYTGNGVSGVFLWGAMLEQSSTVGEYIPTTSTINSAPRFDHNPTTGESLGLLVEEARTNVLLNSATLSTQSVTVAAAANTLSFYGTGTVTLTGVSTAGPLVGTGANNRVSLTFTPTVGVLILTVSGSVTNAQLEAGAFPTSYIPTVAATVTRAADVASITGTNFSSWYRQDEGTIFVEGATSASTASPILFQADDGTANERIQVRRNGTTNASSLLVTDGGTTQANFSVTGYNANTIGKTCAMYSLNDFQLSFNGTLGTADTNGTLPTVDRAFIGSASSPVYANGPIKRLTFWPTRLANTTTLQQITQP